MVSRGGGKIEKFERACQKLERKPALCYAQSGGDWQLWNREKGERKMRGYQISSILCCLLAAAACGCASGSYQNVYDGACIRVSQKQGEEGGVLLHIEYKKEALETMEEGQAVCEAVSKKAARGGCLTLSDGQKISLDQTAMTPEGQHREALYGMTAPSLGALEEILGVDLLEPEGLREEGAGRVYALTADPDFSSITITSEALPWKGQMLTMGVTLFPNSAGQRIADDTAETEPSFCELQGPGACRADVMLLPDRAGIVLSANQILYEYTLSSGEKETVQDFLDSLMAEGSLPASS